METGTLTGGFGGGVVTVTGTAIRAGGGGV
jgi:hypothetical protein